MSRKVRQVLIVSIFFFNFKLNIQDTEYSIRNKLIDLLTELKALKFVTTSVLEFKKNNK